MPSNRSCHVTASSDDGTDDLDATEIFPEPQSPANVGLASTLICQVTASSEDGTNDLDATEICQLERGER